MPAEDQPYVEQVEAFFVSTIRRGLMLRSSDVEMIRDWQARRVPLDVVRRGIVAGITDFLSSSDPHEPLPATLKYFRTRVEAEFEAHQRAVERGLVFSATTGTGSAPDLLVQARGLLERWSGETSVPTRKAVFDGAIGRLDNAEDESGVLACLESLDAFIVEALMETAPAATADRIRLQVSQRIEDAVSRGLGRTAQADVERSALLDAVAEEFGYPGLVKTLVDTAA